MNSVFSIYSFVRSIIDAACSIDFIWFELFEEQLTFFSFAELRRALWHHGIEFENSVIFVNVLFGINAHFLNLRFYGFVARRGDFEKLYNFKEALVLFSRLNIMQPFIVLLFLSCKIWTKVVGVYWT